MTGLGLGRVDPPSRFEAPIGTNDSPGSATFSGVTEHGTAARP